jgi:hypothetical protein
MVHSDRALAPIRGRHTIVFRSATPIHGIFNGESSSLAYLPPRVPSHAQECRTHREVVRQLPGFGLTAEDIVDSEDGRIHWRSLDRSACMRMEQHPPARGFFGKGHSIRFRLKVDGHGWRQLDSGPSIAACPLRVLGHHRMIGGAYSTPGRE